MPVTVESAREPRKNHSRGLSQCTSKESGFEGKKGARLSRKKKASTERPGEKPETKNVKERKRPSFTSSNNLPDSHKTEVDQSSGGKIWEKGRSFVAKGERKA